MSKSKLIVGGLLCLIASMAWGAMFPVAALALQHIDPYYFSVIRYVSVSIILALILLVKEGIRSFRLEGRGGLLLLYGTMAFTVYNLLVFAGQDLLGDPGTIIASLGEALMPMIAVVLLWIGYRAKPSRTTMICLLISFVGAVFVVTNGDLGFLSRLHQQVIPLLMIIAAMIGWVVYTNGGSRFGDWSILRYSTITCLLGTLVSVVIIGAATAFGLLTFPTVETIIAIRWEMSFMVFIAGIVALLSWNAGIKALSPINGILFINFVPVTTLVIMAARGYTISLFEYIGIGLVIYALIHNNMYQRKAHAMRMARRSALAASEDRTGSSDVMITEGYKKEKKRKQSLHSGRGARRWWQRHRPTHPI